EPKGSIDQDPRRAGPRDVGHPARRAGASRPERRAQGLLRPADGRRRGAGLQHAHRLRVRPREAAPDARPPGDGRRERRVPGVVPVAPRLRQERPALLAAARADGRGRGARRPDEQDAL
ncbi:MAG: hypothetical protein AVDCRST_MAG02-2463, partial [uncultured Rubrobacteraceae bacterium]